MERANKIVDAWSVARGGPHPLQNEPNAHFEQACHHLLSTRLVGVEPGLSYAMALPNLHHEQTEASL